MTKKQRINLFALTVLMIIGGFFEMLSVSMMLPFVEVMMNPQKTMENKIVSKICGLVGIKDSNHFLVIMAISMAIIYILKNVYLLFELTVQNKFVYGNMFYTQKRLLKSYLTRPYEYYMDVKSGEVLRVIGADTSQAYGVLAQIVYFLSEMVVSIALFVVVFLMVPVITAIMAAVLLSITALLMGILKPLLGKAGHLRQSSSSDMNQWILQSIQGIKEIKVSRSETFFEKKFEKAGHEYVKSTYAQMTLNVIPRYMVEAIAMSTFFIIIGMMINGGVDLESLIPVISGVAMASIRLLPSMNRISFAIGAVAFAEPAVDKMIENLEELKKTSSTDEANNADSTNGEVYKEIKFNKSIQYENVTYKYPTGTNNILEKVDISIFKGQSIGFTGASGAGKTTAVDILLGLLKPQDGKILVDGTDIELNKQSWLLDVGYIPQSIFLLDGSIRENVAFGISGELISDDRIWKALEEASLDEYIRNLPDGLDTQIGERGIRLSGGQRQRIGIARALYNDPQLLIMDEATSALDNETESVIMESINKLHGRKTLIIIAHRLTTIEKCDKVFRVENGKIVTER
ncbi:MAG: ABC transporter ATP-binding protein [Lachnospiraceae bacterium]|nr:ABC transporter ATP-binding protein [Lachnospiraceae bacterium]